MSMADVEREPIVQTRTGKLRGGHERGTVVFRGIRFAQPPVGALRFRAPQPVQPWRGVRDALTFAPVCPQAKSPLTDRKGEPEGDDCLALNVWTPALGGKRRPVMLWYHGGGFTNGSGSQPYYNGVTLAQHDVVVVTMNYRLGLLGFMDAEDFGPEYAGSGNCAVLDAVAALQWVHDNIAAFGGDPKNVTIFGSSAGGVMVTQLLATPRAYPLFNRGIIQSGAFKLGRSQEVAKRSTRRFCKSAGIVYGDKVALQALSTQAILDIANKGFAFTGPHTADQDPQDAGPVSFGPTTGDSVIPVSPDQVIAAKTGFKGDLMIGSCGDEFTMFVSPMTLGKAALDTSKMAPINGQAAMLKMSVDDLYAAYRKFHPGMSDFDLRVRINSDAIVLMGQDLAEEYRNVNPRTYRYLFDWQSPVMGGALGATHGMELSFEWGTFDTMRNFVGDSPPQALADRIQKAFVDFARTGKPGWKPWSGPGGELMRFDTVSTVGPDPFAEKAKFWKAAFPRVAT